MKQTKIRAAFESFLRGHGLRLTTQRGRIFDRAFATHAHFSAEELLRWLSDEQGVRVSRATVYRTLALLVEGRFMKGLDAGTGELKYEHILGHQHHDHMLCLGCGRIEEFFDRRIEELQEAACQRKGFELVTHDLRLQGYCRSCRRRREQAGAERKKSAAAAGDALPGS